MERGLHAFMAGIIDYAGLFPPARLPLDAAIRNYAAYWAQPEAWMLGRFICPAARLGELAPYGDELFARGEPFRFSALGRGGATTREFLDGVDADLMDIASFQDQLAGGVVVDAYETRLPRPFDGAIDAVAERFEASGPEQVAMSFEASSSPSGKETIQRVVRAIAETGAAAKHGRVTRVGLKLRCGGVEVSAFPSVEQVAFVIIACRDAGVPLKCTAGLHHPVRHHSNSVKTKMHGFLNVFGAGILAHATGIDGPTLREIVADESPDSFAFDADGFRWRNYRGTVAQIEAARASAMLSFGSCSFDEPSDDLRALGLL